MAKWTDDVSVAILAGGKGTRLRSVVADRPKVLAPVCGRPFVAYLLDQLAAAGVRQTVLLTCHAADQVNATLGFLHAGMRLAYSVETSALGTAGALRRALRLLPHDTVLLLNGDSYCDADLDALVRFHRSHHGPATLTLAWADDTSRFGRVELGSTGRISAFAEKGGAATAGWLNAGVYLLAGT